MGRQWQINAGSNLKLDFVCLGWASAQLFCVQSVGASMRTQRQNKIDSFCLLVAFATTASQGWQQDFLHVPFSPC